MSYLTPPTSDVEQGDVIDVIDDCPILQLAADATLATAGAGVQVLAQRVVVLTQTCDIAQDKSAHLVVAVVHPAAELVAAGVFRDDAVRGQVRNGRTFGWYYLPAYDPAGIPESLVNLRDLHTVPMKVIGELVAASKRPARLAVPYREHLAQHFAMSYMRIALPEP